MSTTDDIQLNDPQTLYRRWEDSQWSPFAIDLSADREQWQAMDAADQALIFFVLSSLMVAEERITTKFSVAEPAINFTLNEGVREGGLGAFNHAGIQVASTADVLAAKERLVGAGLAAFDELDTTCCYARQDKIWVRDPDGTPWEVFVTHEDVDEAGTGGLAAAEDAACGCGQTGCACAATGAADVCCA